MSVYRVDVQVFDEFAYAVDEARARRVVEAALEGGACEAGARVSAVIADDDVVRDLNREYRGLDETTDVLSFSYAHEGEYHGEEPPSGDAAGFDFALPPDARDQVDLGEVIVSYPQARRQAESAGRDVGRELAMLLLHGVLHLLGHDHEAADEEAAMRRAERSAWALMVSRGSIV